MNHPSLPRVPAFHVRVVANPEHPDGERYAEQAREVIDAALTAAGYPAYPRLRLVTLEDDCAAG